MNDAELFFIGEAIRHATTLPLGAATNFLSGMIESLGREHPAYVRLVLARDHFNSADAQLELIATGQLKMEAVLQS
jgi:hypothetical protein